MAKSRKKKNASKGERESYQASDISEPPRQTANTSPENPTGTQSSYLQGQAQQPTYQVDPQQQQQSHYSQEPYMNPNYSTTSNQQYQYGQQQQQYNPQTNQQYQYGQQQQQYDPQTNQQNCPQTNQHQFQQASTPYQQAPAPYIAPDTSSASHGQFPSYYEQHPLPYGSQPPPPGLSPPIPASSHNPYDPSPHLSGNQTAYPTLQIGGARRMQQYGPFRMPVLSSSKQISIWNNIDYAKSRKSFRNLRVGPQLSSIGAKILVELFSCCGGPANFLQRQGDTRAFLEMVLTSHKYFHIVQMAVNSDPQTFKGLGDVVNFAMGLIADHSFTSDLTRSNRFPSDYDGILMFIGTEHQGDNGYEMEQKEMPWSCLKVVLTYLVDLLEHSFYAYVTKFAPKALPEIGIDEEDIFELCGRVWGWLFKEMANNLHLGPRMENLGPVGIQLKNILNHRAQITSGYLLEVIDVIVQILEILDNNQDAARSPSTLSLIRLKGWIHSWKDGCQQSKNEICRTLSIQFAALPQERTDMTVADAIALRSRKDTMALELLKSRKAEGEVEGMLLRKKVILLGLEEAVVDYVWGSKDATESFTEPVTLPSRSQLVEEDFDASKVDDTKHDKLQEELTCLLKRLSEFRDTASKEQAALERQLRESEEAKRLAEEKVKVVKSASEEAKRLAEEEVKAIKSESEEAKRLAEEEVKAIKSESEEAMLVAEEELNDVRSESRNHIGVLEHKLAEAEAKITALQQAAENEDTRALNMQLSEEINKRRVIQPAKAFVRARKAITQRLTAVSDWLTAGDSKKEAKRDREEDDEDMAERTRKRARRS